MKTSMAAFGLVLALMLASETAASQIGIYQYTARTAEPVDKSGEVKAGSLTWQCRKSACTITGPWRTPGVSACAALANEVGRIVEYGHPGEKLNTQQLAECNKGLAPVAINRAAGNLITQVNPNVLQGSKAAEQAKEAQKPAVPVGPRLRVPLKPVTESAGGESADAPAAGAGTGPELAIEEGSYRDYRLYIRPEAGMAFHGTYDGAYPSSPDVPAVAWRGGVLAIPALRHTGADHPDETASVHGVSPEDTSISVAPSGRHVDVPLDLRNLPDQVRMVRVVCSPSVIPQGTGVYVAGALSEQNVIGFAEGHYWAPRESGDWSLVRSVRLPVNLSHFMRPEDIKSVTCTLNLKVQRVGGGGVDDIPMLAAADPDSPRFVPGLAPAAGTASRLRVDVNVETP